MSPTQKHPTIVLVGRSNVGKSSLFNTLASRKQALVSPVAGTTRDRLDATLSWGGRTIRVIDTGGLDPSKDDVYNNDLKTQAHTAIADASLLLFVVDVRVGMVPADMTVFKALRALKKPVFLVVNKCDAPHHREGVSAFKKWKLPTFPVAATTGSGIGDLLDAVIQELPDNDTRTKKSDLSLALVGQPNVGKSSLLNSIFGSERMIVSPIAHTTRDAQDVQVAYKGTRYTVIDTAGIRRRTKSGDDVEQLSVAKSEDAIKRSDVVGLVIDISQPVASQDKRLARLIEDSRKGIFIVANKWDLIPDKDSNTIQTYTHYINQHFPGLAYAPIIFISAQDHKRTKEVLNLSKEVYGNMQRKITDNALSHFVQKIVKKRKPTIGKGTRRPRLLRLFQRGTNPPVFELSIPNKTRLAQSYKQYIINSLRESFDFEGVPLSLKIQERMPEKDDIEAPKGRRRPTHRRHHY